MSDAKKPFHNPFEALSHLRSALPEPPAPPPPGPTAVSPAATPIPRAVVRLERSGRGGKEVTVVEHLDLKPADREGWLKALKGALGCGGVIEGEALVLQGDHRKRLPGILTAKGVKKVIIG